MKTPRALYRVYVMPDETIVLAHETVEPLPRLPRRGRMVDEDGCCDFLPWDRREMRNLGHAPVIAGVALVNSLNLRRVLRKRIEPRLVAIEKRLDALNKRIDRLLAVLEGQRRPLRSP